jgi:SAM domain (Sterile alpha motif)/Adenylate and Guanylate cyclase catalytic domain
MVQFETNPMDHRDVATQHREWSFKCHKKSFPTPDSCRRSAVGLSGAANRRGIIVVALHGGCVMLWRNREGRQVATITEWLASLGLPEYAQRFAENGIDVSVLRYLTDQDLEKIGVLLGHRRKMLAAIAGLSGAAPVMPRPASPPEEKRPHGAERRQLTVMFTDLVGSTALSTKLDPEDLRSVIAAYHKCVAETVARFDGFVAKYMGDGVLVYFGYPQAHEHDAERAVRAGLALVEAVPKLATHGGSPLHCGSGSRPDSWWLAISSVRVPRRSRLWSARRQILLPASRRSPSLAPWSLHRARGG